MGGGKFVSLQYKDLHGNYVATSRNEVEIALERLAAFKAALKEQFYERDEVIDKLNLALMLREHLLFIGPPGTAKSKLFSKAFRSIQGAEVFRKDLTRFTTDTHIFGAYDVREMEKTGRMVHMTDRTLATAHLAHMGEFFDASDALSRNLLGALNERRYQNGPQEINLRLMTCVADSNFRPEDMPQRARQLEAVVDRFLFKAEIPAGIEDPRADFQMHEDFLGGKLDTPLPRLDLGDIVIVSGLITGHRPNLFANKYVLEAYVELKRSISSSRESQGRPPFSPRRSLAASQIVEAQALLSGRDQATFDDLWAVQHVLASCLDDISIVEREASESIKRWVAKSARHEIEIEISKLSIITGRIPASVDLSKMASKEVFALKALLQGIIDDLNTFQADALEVKNQANKATTQCAKLLIDADVRLLTIIDQHIVEKPGEIPHASLEKARDNTLALQQVLTKINPGSHETVVAHSRLSQRLSLALEILNKRWAKKEVDDLLAQWGT